VLPALCLHLHLLLLLLPVLVCLQLLLQHMCRKMSVLESRGVQNPRDWPAAAKACTQLLLSLLLQECLLHLHAHLLLLLLLLLLPCSCLHARLQLLLW
jgi:hypothetical protein